MPGQSLEIALISEHASPLAGDIGGTDAGGQNVYVRALAAGLAGLGHRVTVYTRRTAARQPARVSLAPGADVVHVTAGPARELPKEDLAPFMGDFGDQLALAWRDQPPDIAHAHYWMSGVAAIGGARRTPIPVVATFHALAAERLRHHPSALLTPAGDDAGKRRHRERERERDLQLGRAAVERTVAQEASAIIALTAAEADYLAGPSVKAPAAKISVVPVGVDLTRFTPDGPVRGRGTRPRLVTVSRLTERKGVRTVIEALASVPGCELLIAGGPDPAVTETDPVVRTLRDHARRHGVHDRVTFLGRVPHPDIPALLRSADVFVSAPYYEPFGTSALEAAACGIPVVTTAVGGLREHVLDQVTGYLVPPPDTARPQPADSPVATAIASAAAFLIADPSLRKRLGAAGAREAARYAWPAIVNEIISVYRRL